MSENFVHKKCLSICVKEAKMIFLTTLIYKLNPKPSATAMSTATSTAKNGKKSSSRSL